MAADDKLRLDAVDDRIVLAGELDLHTAPMLEAELTRASSDPIEIELADVTFIDSSGLRVLVAERQKRGQDGLVLRSPSAVVRRLLEVTGLDGHLRVLA
ncbi:MAG: STAS domain-containing protein [Actinomycetota bacterium]|nr:STAS domain-containing protein [Actinomycetota bacterium]